jgi:pSer/pThr/pTyr-binding forkhead associated (FHA) protein
MPENTSPSKPSVNADWFLRGVLTKIGDTFDRLTGRRWMPSSSLAASELTDRIKKLLDAEAKEVPGKGTVVPHNIKLKMQWDKFSDDSETALETLRNELLTAASDHINDSLYYTYAPLSLEIKKDYFIEGVKLYVSFDKFSDEESDVEQNVTVLGMKLSELLPAGSIPISTDTFIARYVINEKSVEKNLDLIAGRQQSVGRMSANDLMLDDNSVSKIHASLVTDSAGVLSVADTGSTNGTFVNDERIAYGKAIRLAEGDAVKFGDIEVRFEHIPKALQTDQSSPESPDNAVEIDGLKFKSRIMPTHAPNKSSAIEIPNESLKVPSVPSNTARKTTMFSDDEAADEFKTRS